MDHPNMSTHHRRFNATSDCPPSLLSVRALPAPEAPLPMLGRNAGPRRPPTRCVQRVSLQEMMIFGAESSKMSWRNSSELHVPSCLYHGIHHFRIFWLPPLESTWPEIPLQSTWFVWVSAHWRRSVSFLPRKKTWKDWFGVIMTTIIVIYVIYIYR